MHELRHQQHHEQHQQDEQHRRMSAPTSCGDHTAAQKQEPRDLKHGVTHTHTHARARGRALDLDGRRRFPVQTLVRLLDAVVV